jgi:hypothetical protein
MTTGWTYRERSERTRDRDRRREVKRQREVRDRESERQTERPFSYLERRYEWHSHGFPDSPRADLPFSFQSPESCDTKVAVNQKGRRGERR